MTIDRIIRALEDAVYDVKQHSVELEARVDDQEIEIGGLQAEVSGLEDKLRDMEACIMPHCPNPRSTKSGHCHYHRYLRYD